jgi:hypothetical protein
VGAFPSRFPPTLAGTLLEVIMTAEVKPVPAERVWADARAELNDIKAEGSRLAAEQQTLAGRLVAFIHEKRYTRLYESYRSAEAFVAAEFPGDELARQVAERVEIVRALRDAGVRQRVIAAKLDLSTAQVSRILGGKTGNERRDESRAAQSDEKVTSNSLSSTDTTVDVTFDSGPVTGSSNGSTGLADQDSLPVTGTGTVDKLPVTPEVPTQPTGTQAQTAEAAPAATPEPITHSDGAGKSPTMQEPDQALIARQSARITELTDQVMNLGTRYEAQITELKTRITELTKQNAALEAQLRTALLNTQCVHDDRQWQRMTAVMTALEERFGADTAEMLLSGGGREEQPWA